MQVVDESVVSSLAEQHCLVFVLIVCRRHHLVVADLFRHVWRLRYFRKLILVELYYLVIFRKNQYFFWTGYRENLCKAPVDPQLRVQGLSLLFRFVQHLHFGFKP